MDALNIWIYINFYLALSVLKNAGINHSQGDIRTCGAHLPWAIILRAYGAIGNINFT
jgi:hypothetical protein